MEKNYKVIVTVSNYEGGQKAYTKDIDNTTFEKFRPIMKAISNKLPSKGWNWFDRLPETWDNDLRSYDYDKFTISIMFKTQFDDGFCANDIIAFYDKFTPHGADAITKIEVVKFEEVEL